MDISKIGYKQGIFQLNPNNLGRHKTFKDCENDFLSFLESVREERNVEKKCSMLIFSCFVGGFGSYITKEYFIKLLEYVDLDWEFFESQIIQIRKVRCLSLQTFWFDTLTFKTFKECEDYINLKFKDLKNG